MSSLNKSIFDAALAWHLENTETIYVMVTNQITDFDLHPDVAKFISNIGKSNGRMIGILTLNISPRSCKLEVTEEGIFISARFNGQLRDSFFTWDQVYSIADRDNPETTVSLPYKLAAVLNTEKSTVVKEEPKKVNPFSVITGGKND